MPFEFPRIGTLSAHDGHFENNVLQSKVGTAKALGPQEAQRCSFPIRHPETAFDGPSRLIAIQRDEFGVMKVTHRLFVHGVDLLRSTTVDDSALARGNAVHQGLYEVGLDPVARTGWDLILKSN